MQTTLAIDKVASDHQVLSFGDNEHAVVFFNPFRVEVYQDDELVISANNRNLFNFEPIMESKADDYIEPEVQSPDATKPGNEIIQGKVIITRNLE
jgi:hypothetical protein